MTPTNIAFSIPGEPQGKGRARIGRVGAHARMFTPAKTVAYEGLIALAGQQAMRGADPIHGPVAVEIDAIHTIPASWSKKRRHEATGGPAGCKPDIDNIAKAVADGSNGVIWVDDKQITRLTVTKVYGERPEVRVRVAVL